MTITDSSVYNSLEFALALLICLCCAPLIWASIILSNHYRLLRSHPITDDEGNIWLPIRIYDKTTIFSMALLIAAIAAKVTYLLLVLRDLAVSSQIPYGTLIAIEALTYIFLSSSIFVQMSDWIKYDARINASGLVWGKEKYDRAVKRRRGDLLVVAVFVNLVLLVYTLITLKKQESYI